MQKRGNNIWQDREKRYIVIKSTIFWQNPNLYSYMKYRSVAECQAIKKDS